MARTYLEKMGLKPVEKLNKKICLERVRVLRKKIDSGKFTGRLLKQARYYRGWYQWIADNGGQRPKARPSRSTKKSA